MKDLTQRLRMLRDDAEECLLISRLATDQTKRQTYRKLATQLEADVSGATDQSKVRTLAGSVKDLATTQSASQ